MWETFINSLKAANIRFAAMLADGSAIISSYQKIVSEDLHVEQVVEEENGSQLIEETTTIKTKTIYSDSYSEIIANLEVKSLVPQIPANGAGYFRIVLYCLMLVAVKNPRRDRYFCRLV